MRARLCFAALLVGLSACRGGTGDETPEGAGGAGQPTAVSEDGVALYVERVQRRGDGAEVVFTVVNPTNRALTLSRSHDPITLRDARGGTLTGPEETIRVEALARDRLTVAFAGEADGPLTLRTNTRGGSPNAPQLTVADLPARGARFAPVERAPITPTGATAHHANGTSVTVQRIAFGPETVDVDVQVVNGHDGGIDLGNSGAYLQDEAGRRYALVPPANNEDLDVPEGQAMSGTLRFAGRVPAGVRALTLTFNGRFGGSEDFSRSPKIVVPNLTLAP